MQVPQDGVLLQIPQIDHVFDAVDGSDVHVLENLLMADVKLPAIVAFHPDPLRFNTENFGAEGDVELPVRHGMHPHVVPLKRGFSYVEGGTAWDNLPRRGRSCPPSFRLLPFSCGFSEGAYLSLGNPCRTVLS